MKQPVLLTFNIPEAVTAKLRLICPRLQKGDMQWRLLKER